MIVVSGETDGGRFDQLVPDDRVDEWVATLESVTAKPIRWTFTPTTATDLRQATTQVNETR